MKTMKRNATLRPKVNAYTPPWRFLLQTYLRNALCPAPTSGGVPLRERPKERPWNFSISAEASGANDSVALTKSTSPTVVELDIWDFRTMVRKYVDGAPDCFITENDKPFMDMPCYDVNSLTEGHVNFLSRVNTQDEFMLLIMKFILGPVTECCRILNNISRNVPLAKSLEFIALRGPHSASVVDWDVLRIPATVHGEGALSIICVPPWKLDFEDLRAFSMPTKIPENYSHPRFMETSAEAISNANNLWQVVLDACAPAGPCFVVTNYVFWCFGKFRTPQGSSESVKGKGKAKDVDEGWTTVTVSTPIELEMSVPNSVRLPMMTEPMGLGCTVPECLTFWIQMTRGAAAWLPQVD
ncbi:hypothetical protein BDP27DRAFT_1415185 [Rhodocollybia butyracea]|uniref:Uncharacterized protein n=1 Tax=Rhodocollybia butyracea TaxID=206335 RepID=A0A9P5Q761_9AGAR|nr:hypothetical protein BDP27DRAFT_1415185 [Rhodocollybia butyracea]